LKSQKIEEVSESDNFNCSNNKSENFSRIGTSLSHHQQQQNEKRWEREVAYFLTHPELKKLIRLTKTQFNKLLSTVKEYFELYTVKGKRRSNQVYRNRNWKTRISYPAHLFITLYWLRNYPTNAVLTAQFGLDKRDVTCILNRTLLALDEALDFVIKCPTDEEFEEMKVQFHGILGEKFSDAVVTVVDGTEICISRPKDSQKQKAVWSVKKHQNSVTILVMSRPDGVLLYVSPPMIGANDQQHWNQLNLRELFTDKHFGIIGDGGFTFNHQSKKQHPNEQPIIGFTPYKKPSKGKLTESQRKYNTALSKIRVIIENVIGQIKKWKILGTVYRHFSLSKNNQISFELVIRVVTKLTALLINNSHLRAKNWTPTTDP
jgi:hypothetical protein